ncbi:MAG: SPFH domain-containing protein [Cyanobacteria bacterium P01_H01_bin.153]
MRLIGEAIAALEWNMVVSGVRVAAERERDTILRLGKLQDLRGPGILYVIPIVESVQFLVQFIDTRTLVINIPKPKVITRDNGPTEIDSALFFQISDAEKAVASIQDFCFGISQYAQAALRAVVGGLTLDELWSERLEGGNVL